MLGAIFLFWGCIFHLLSVACFTLTQLYVTMLELLVLNPLSWFTGVPNRERQQLHTMPQQRSDLRRLRHLPDGCTEQATSQELVHRWFNAAATADDLNSPSSCPSVSSCAHVAPHAAAAAAAAMAVVSTANMPTDKALCTVGAAAMLASHLSRVSEPGSVSTPKRISSCQYVPPLEYDASVEQQQELDNIAPTEFLCPLGRVLMTDPVFTPSGFTYHRPCIMDFILRTGRDPARDNPLAPEQLCCNVNMRDQVATWLQKHGVQT